MTKDLQHEFLLLLNKHKGIVHRICNGYFLRQDVRKDAYQEIVYQLWKSYPSFKGLSKVSTWMYRVALNTAIRYSREVHHANALIPLDDAEQVWEQDDQYLRNEQLGMLYKAISNLSAMDKAIILLYLDERSYDEISVITGLTKSNISVKLVRIKRKLEKTLTIKENKP